MVEIISNFIFNLIIDIYYVDYIALNKRGLLTGFEVLIRKAADDLNWLAVATTNLKTGSRLYLLLPLTV